MPVCMADSVLAWHGVKSSRNRLRSPFSLVVPSLMDYAVHVAARPLAIIGDENARLRSRLPLTEWSSAMEQASFNQMYRFDQSPSAQAERLRKEARGTPAGVRRDQLLRRARQIETASSVQERPKSPGLKSPTPKSGWPRNRAALFPGPQFRTASLKRYFRVASASRSISSMPLADRVGRRLDGGVPCQGEQPRGCDQHEKPGDHDGKEELVHARQCGSRWVVPGRP